MNETKVTRRELLASLAGSITAALALTTLLPATARGDGTPKITVYKDPSCGCCTKWVEHLRAAGFSPAVQDRSDMDELKDSLGVPARLRSCHTAVAGKYVIEGHVPAADIKRLTMRAPKGIVGVAVPDMPAGAPGMEMPGRRDRYDVIAFFANGTTSVFARH
ncbi:MAG TPA: DUF411 domain-containing protein [Gemmatimonadaceae bacterium]|nr:DUF411 domain-containing protein [Gemmatimonadaceae bacterium]